MPGGPAAAGALSRAPPLVSCAAEGAGRCNSSARCTWPRAGGCASSSPARRPFAASFRVESQRRAVQIHWDWDCLPLRPLRAMSI